MMEESQHTGSEISSSVEAGSKNNADEAHFTVYVGNLAPQANEVELETLFAHLAQPTNVKVMRDRATGMSSGFGFVTFAERYVAEHALESLNGQMAWGRPLKLQWAQHRGGGNVAALTDTPTFDVFVGDLARDVDEQKLREAFSQVGNVTRVVVMLDYPSGRNKGYGFVSYATQQEAEAAIQQMHGALVGSRSVRCGWGQRRAGGQAGGQQQFPQQRGGRNQLHQMNQQQQQWGRQRGPGAFPPQAFPQSYPQLPPMMMGMPMGMDAQQAQQLQTQQLQAQQLQTQQLQAQQLQTQQLQAQLAQQSQSFQPGRSIGDASPAASTGPVVNGAMDRAGRRQGKGSKGSGAQGQQKAPAADAQKAGLQHPAAGSSVSLPALAEGGTSSGASCCVRVDNVDKTVQKAELFGAFAKFGTLEDCNIVRKGNPYHAIIRFAAPQQAMDAAAGMNGFSLDGRRLRCAVEGGTPPADNASTMPRPKSTSDLPLPPRALDRAQAVEALAAKMRAVLQDRGELPAASPPTGGRGGPVGASENAAAAVAAAASLGMAGSLGQQDAGGIVGTERQRASPRAALGSATGGSGGLLSMTGRSQAQHVQQAQHASHQWISPGFLQGSESPMVAAGTRQGGGIPPQHKQVQPNWAQQPQHMLAPQLLMAQQAQQAMRSAPPPSMMQSSMPPVAYGTSGVVLPPQLAMLNMMAQGSMGGTPPAFTLPMMYGGQPMLNPQGMQPGFAALQQQALIQQLLLHQQAQQQAQQAAAAAAAEQEMLVPAPGSLNESVPSTGGTPPPNSSTPPPGTILPLEATAVVDS